MHTATQVKQRHTRGDRHSGKRHPGWMTPRLGRKRCSRDLFDQCHQAHQCPTQRISSRGAVLAPSC
eukprot:10037065-Karenia_brevis.AAC.1